VFVKNVNLADCWIDIEAGPPRNNDAIAAGLRYYVPGVLIAVTREMIYTSRRTGLLRSWRDANGDLQLGPGEDRQLADGIYDLQIALGYDGNSTTTYLTGSGEPVDNRVTDTADATDEWLWNAAGDQGFGVDGSAFEFMASDQLRMIEVGVAAGVSARLGASTWPKLLDGVPPSVTQRPPGLLYFASSTSKAFLRNSSLFK
jgi:hypothetical protein